MILCTYGMGSKICLRKVILPLFMLALLWAFSVVAVPQSPVMAQEPTLAAPTNLTARVIAEGVVLSWTAPAGTIDGYEILRRRPLQGEVELTTLVDNTGSSDTSYTDTSATELGVQYAYRVKSIRGDDRSEQSDFVRVDVPTTALPTSTPTSTPTATPTATPVVNASVSCEILAGSQHDVLQCTVSADDLTITSADWTPSFEVQYAQTTDRPVANWVIADEYCGQSTDVEVDAQAGDRVLPAAETTITLTCTPAPTDSLSVSCENLIVNSQHTLSCALSGGDDQNITRAYWQPYFEPQSALEKEGEDLREATWVVDQAYCGQATTLDVDLYSGSESLPSVGTSFTLPCVIKVDDNCSLANAIRSANGIAQVEESGDSDGNDDCEDGGDPDDSTNPPDTGDDIILLTKNVTLTTPLPSLTSRIRIEGDGHTISGDAKHHVLMVVGGQLGINDLTISKGLASSVGGGIYINSGSLSVSDSTIKDNKANDIGGGIYAIDSDVDIADTEFSGNMTVKSHGGGVYFISSTGLHTLDITGVTFKKNMATEDGGALKTAGGIATINKSTFVENAADEGGAIESSQTTLDITNSTFSNNSAREGGGLSSFSSFVTLTHTTWAYNSAEEQGGGIAIIGWTGNFKIRNTLISNSKSGGDCHSGPNPDIIIEFTGNIIQDGSCTPEPAASQAAGAVGQAEAQQVFVAEAQNTGANNDPQIRGLTGDPPHHPLQWGSPAIDAADPLYCLLDDQRFAARPQYGNCDIGAYEYPRAPDPPPAPPPEPTDEPDDDPPEPDDTPTARPPTQTPTPTPEPFICIVNGRIIVRSPNDDVECAEIDTITLDKHPALEGIRFAMRLWRSNNDCMHVVSENDNLYRLAIQYDTSVDVLRRHNNLRSDILSVGQLLLHSSCSPEAAYFAPGTEVCFATPGRLVFIDTATAERTVHTLETYVSDSMTCGEVNQPGIVALVASDSS